VTATTTALELDGLTKRFARTEALSGVSLTVPDGQLRAIIGPNGAGKSTLFALISGVHEPTAGGVRFYGRDITGKPPAQVVRLGIGRAFQVARLFADLTVLDNVRTAVHAHRRTAWRFFRTVRSHREATDAAIELLEEVGLGAEASTQAGVLSQGDKKLLELSMALALEPRVLLLDEPTAGMSPGETQQTVDILRQLHQSRGITILLTEHDMGVVFALAQEVSVLHYGRLLRTGTPVEVRADPQVIDVYLGEPL
jgi:branched-chain amino acid transport system ATP-binding protein